MNYHDYQEMFTKKIIQIESFKVDGHQWKWTVVG